jgi:cytochrome P450
MIYAATDSTSGVLARILSILAEHPDVQDKLRQEVTEARKDNIDLDYDDLTSLSYLDAICRETLRLWDLNFHRFEMYLTDFYGC